MTETTTARGFLQAVPNILWQQRRWIRWKDKRPIAWGSDRWTSYHDQREWRAGEQIEWPRTGGVGFSLSKPVEIDGYQLLAFDLDACRNKDTGVIEPWAEMFVACCRASYTEITPSGQGLRVWVLVKNLPEMHQSEWKPLAMSRAPGTTKQVECQVYGGSCVGYVTVTGNQLPDTATEVVKLLDLDWWPKVFGQPIDAGVGRSVGEAGAWDGEGFGDEPTMEEVRAAVRSTPAGVALMDCAWKGNPALNGLAEKSNSEAWAALEVLAVKAARWHREAAVKFLLRECPRWSDPGMRECYSREDWVRKDLARVAPSKPAFPVLPDEPSAPTPAEQIEQKVRKPWVRRSLAELLTEKSPPWTVQHYVRCKQVGIIASFPGVGKSTLAAAWMMSALHGQPWCGKKVRAGSVVALVGENRRGFSNTCYAYAKKHGFDEPPPGRYLEIVDYQLPLSSKEGQKRIFEMLAEIVAEKGEAPVLVVIDTLSSHWAENEDSSEFMAPAMRALAALAERWNCTVVVLHHTTKVKGRTVMPEASDVRGSGVSVANTDFTFGMCQPEDGEVHLAGLKLKNDKEPARVKLVITAVDCGVDQDGEPVTAGAFDNQFLGVTKEEEKASQQLEVDLGRVVEALRAIGTATSKGAIVEQVRMQAQRGGRLIDLGVARGLIINTGTSRNPVYRAANKEQTSTPFRPLYQGETPELD